MKFVAVKQAIRVTREALLESLNDSLHALYLFGSLVTGKYKPGCSDVNLLAVVADDANLYDLHAAFQPLWDAYAPILKRTPLIVPRRRLARHLHLQPQLAHALREACVPLSGSPDLLRQVEPPATAVDHQSLSALAREAMELSLLLAPGRLPPAIVAPLGQRLQQLAWKTTRCQITAETPPARLLAQIHEALERSLAGHPEINWPAGDAVKAGALIPGHQASYEYGGNLLLVLKEPLAPRIQETGWPGLLNKLTSPYEALQVVSATQLRLIAQLARPVEFTLRSYQHVWGLDPLDGITISSRALFQAAARRADSLQMETLSHAFLTTAADNHSHLIHDFQNTLLNIQLQNELINRLHRLPSIRPPALPDRAASRRQRILALFKQFDWWAEYYWAKVAAANATST